MAIILISKYVVYIKNIIAILVIIAIVFNAFARFSEYSARISRRLVFKSWIAYSICRWQLCSQCLKRLFNGLSDHGITERHLQSSH